MEETRTVKCNNVLKNGSICGNVIAVRTKDCMEINRHGRKIENIPIMEGVPITLYCEKCRKATIITKDGERNLKEVNL